jgi:hypothetical protein
MKIHCFSNPVNGLEGNYVDIVQGSREHLSITICMLLSIIIHTAPGMILWFLQSASHVMPDMQNAKRACKHYAYGVSLYSAIAGHTQRMTN